MPNFYYWNLNFTTNPNLYCINVDDASYSDSVWSSFIDPWAIYSEDCSLEIPGCIDSSANNYDPLATVNDGSCSFGMTYVPDDNFEQALIDLGYDTDTILNDSVLADESIFT